MRCHFKDGAVMGLFLIALTCALTIGNDIEILLHLVDGKPLTKIV